MSSPFKVPRCCADVLGGEMVRLDSGDWVCVWCGNVQKDVPPETQLNETLAPLGAVRTTVKGGKEPSDLAPSGEPDHCVAVYGNGSVVRVDASGITIITNNQRGGVNIGVQNNVIIRRGK